MSLSCALCCLVVAVVLSVVVVAVETGFVVVVS